MAKMITLKECGFCGRNVYKLANPSRGLCAACYYRDKRNGGLEYKGKRTRKACFVNGCDSLSIAKGYCETHYRRLQRHGVVDHERFDKWGHADKHPLAHVYYWMRRAYKNEVCKEWMDDFWSFVRAVGERPSSKHRFKRIDPSKPYQDGNTYWEAPKLDVSTGTKIAAAEYARAHRAANPDSYKDQYLKKRFGVSLEWYNDRLASQNGVCFICAREETATHQKTGLPRMMAVDHCHTHGHVRALLCSKCNTGLGSFRDDPALLRAAADYLENHALPSSPT